ncbi:hypothetical protein Hanom_Chr12g01128761 [Helianthus anomalus]
MELTSWMKMAIFQTFWMQIRKNKPLDKSQNWPNLRDENDILLKKNVKHVTCTCSNRLKSFCAFSGASNSLNAATSNAARPAIDRSPFPSRLSCEEFGSILDPNTAEDRFVFNLASIALNEASKTADLLDKQSATVSICNAL